MSKLAVDTLIVQLQWAKIRLLVAIPIINNEAKMLKPNFMYRVVYPKFAISIFAQKNSIPIILNRLFVLK